MSGAVRIQGMTLKEINDKLDAFKAERKASEKTVKKLIGVRPFARGEKEFAKSIEGDLLKAIEDNKDMETEKKLQHILWKCHKIEMYYQTPSY